MNVADSMRVASALEKLGYHNSPTAKNADVIILNTCVVRQSAEDKAIGRLSSLRPLKDKNPELVINLLGCLVGVKNNKALSNKVIKKVTTCIWVSNTVMVFSLFWS